MGDSEIGFFRRPGFGTLGFNRLCPEISLSNKTVSIRTRGSSVQTRKAVSTTTSEIINFSFPTYNPFVLL